MLTSDILPLDYGYMAIGFSINNRMSNTDVVGCQKSDANTAHAKDTFNPGYSNAHDNNNSAISNFTSSIDGEAFSCWFKRKYIPPISSKGHTLNARDYYVFTAIGVSGFYMSSSNAFNKHASTPCIAGPLDLLGPAIVISQGTDYSLVRAHGMLMLLAWSVFISIGVFFASYSRFLFPNGEWFQAHRFLNASALLIALIGIILIFISVGGWKIQPGGVLWSHQIIGLLSVLIMAINIIVSAFRCRPEARFRWIYHLIHGGFGFIAITLAAIAIILGLYLYYALIGKETGMAYGLWIYVGRLVTEWFFHIPLIIFLIIKRKNCEKNEKYDLPEQKPFKIFLHNIFAPPTCPRGEDRKKPGQGWPFIAFAIVAYIVYAICFYVATVIFVAISEII